jgi:hypothetical protein
LPFNFRLNRRFAGPRPATVASLDRSALAATTSFIDALNPILLAFAILCMDWDHSGLFIVRASQVGGEAAVTIFDR